jgi:hypothetical protein
MTPALLVRVSADTQCHSTRKRRSKALIDLEMRVGLIDSITFRRSATAPNILYAHLIIIGPTDESRSTSPPTFASKQPELEAKDKVACVS